jgi:signal transduction histidine kinase
MVLLAFILSIAQSVASLVVERFGRSDEHSVQDVLAALVNMLQDEMQQTRETIERLGGDDGE